MLDRPPTFIDLRGKIQRALDESLRRLRRSERSIECDLRLYESSRALLMKAKEPGERGEFRNSSR